MWKIVLVFTYATMVHTRSLVVELQSVETEINKDIIREMNITIQTIDKRNVLNGHMVAHTDIPEFDLTAACLIPKSNGRYSAFFNMTVNGCDFISQNHSNSLKMASTFVINTIRKSLKNLPRKCPLKKDTIVWLSNLYIDTEQIPAYLPETRFQFSATLTKRTVLGFRLVTNGMVRLKRGKFGKG